MGLKQYTALDITIHLIEYQISCLSDGRLFTITASVGRKNPDDARKAYAAALPTIMKSLRSFQVEEWNQPVPSKPH